MLTITPTGKTLGATVTGVDLSTPLAAADFAQTLKALGQYGVLRFSGQHIDAAALRDFSLRFGPIQVGLSDGFRQAQVREVGIVTMKSPQPSRGIVVTAAPAVIRLRDGTLERGREILSRFQ